MGDQTVKKQHYIPQSLLELFTDEKGKISEAYLPKGEIYSTRPPDSMCERFIYENSKLKKNSLENYFAKKDDEIAPKIKDIIALLDSSSDQQKSFFQIKKRIEDLLPTFIIFYYRSGALLTEFASLNKEDKIPLLTIKILNESYIKQLSQTIQIGYNFAILKSDEDFIISDQYISTAALGIKSQFSNISNRHIGLKETLLLIPLSSSYYVIYWHTNNPFTIKQDQINILSNDLIESFNKTIINNSYLKCVARKAQIIKKILPYFEEQYPSSTYIGYKSGYTEGAINKKEVFFDDLDKQAFQMLRYANFSTYKNLVPSDNCGCGSGKKYKKCHQNIYKRIKLPLQSFGKSANVIRKLYIIPNVPTVESPIDSWGGYTPL